MDFGQRIPKDKKPGADGLWGWESPRLKKALEEEKKAAQAKTAQGLTPTNYRTIKDCDMIANDLAGLGLPVPRELKSAECEFLPPRAESVCDPYGWITWTPDTNRAGPKLPRGTRVAVRFRDEEDAEGVVSWFRWNAAAAPGERPYLDIVAYKVLE